VAPLTWAGGPLATGLLLLGPVEWRTAPARGDEPLVVQVGVDYL